MLKNRFSTLSVSLCQRFFFFSVQVSVSASCPIVGNPIPRALMLKNWFPLSVSASKIFFCAGPSSVSCSIVGNPILRVSMLNNWFQSLSLSLFFSLSLCQYFAYWHSFKMFFSEIMRMWGFGSLQKVFPVHVVWPHFPLFASSVFPWTVPWRMVVDNALDRVTCPYRFQLPLLHWRQVFIVLHISWDGFPNFFVCDVVCIGYVEESSETPSFPLLGSFSVVLHLGHHFAVRWQLFYTT